MSQPETKTRDPRGRRSRQRPDLVINEVARKVGITPGYVCAILKGKKVPSMKVMERMVEALGLSGLDQLKEELEKYKELEKGKRKKSA